MRRSRATSRGRCSRALPREGHPDRAVPVLPVLGEYGEVEAEVGDAYGGVLLAGLPRKPVYALAQGDRRAFALLYPHGQEFRLRSVAQQLLGAFAGGVASPAVCAGRAPRCSARGLGQARRASPCTCSVAALARGIPVKGLRDLPGLGPVVVVAGEHLGRVCPVGADRLVVQPRPASTTTDSRLAEGPSPPRRRAM